MPKQLARGECVRGEWNKHRANDIPSYGNVEESLVDDANLEGSRRQALLSPA